MGHHREVPGAVTGVPRQWATGGPGKPLVHPTLFPLEVVTVEEVWSVDVVLTETSPGTEEFRPDLGDLSGILEGLGSFWDFSVDLLWPKDYSSTGYSDV